MGRDKQRLLVEWTAARDDAETLLRSLLDARAESETRLAELRLADPMKRVTGRSALDTAIASTQRMISMLNREIQDLKRTLTDEDLSLLSPA